MCEQGLEQCLIFSGKLILGQKGQFIWAGILGRGVLLPNHKGATIIFNLA